MLPLHSGLFVDISHTIGNFNLEVKFKTSNGITALFGRSGSGKSTLVNVLAGLEDARVGSIMIDGVYLFDKNKGINICPQQRRVGYVFQHSRLFPHMNVKNNLIFGMRFIPASENKVDFFDIVDLLDLESLLDRYPNSLSGGERQRIAIGRALLVVPRLILMDEPLASLDADRKAEIIPYIEKLRNELSVPIVYVSHNLEEVVRLADMIVFLENGRSVITGTTEEMMGRLENSSLIGENQPGAVLNAVVIRHDNEFSLSELSIEGSLFFVPKLNLDLGARVRVRVLARDISLCRELPKSISVLNIFKARIIDFLDDESPYTDVLLDIGENLIARITRKSVYEMNLSIGDQVFAMVKAASINEQRVGFNEILTREKNNQ